MDTKFRYPTGARPLLMEEAARRRRIESRFVALLEDGGFAEVVLPVIDFVEPYAGLGDRGAAKQSYRFTDREGDLVAVRSDFTPMLARALAPALPEVQGGDEAVRVFYRGDVIRCDATRLGTNRELFQIGAEIVGDASPSGDLEVLQLAAALATTLSAAPLVVTTRDYPELSADVRFLVHDDDDPSGAAYYTGMRFWVYGDDRRTPIARGGRYDSLYGRFGRDTPAVGFTFTIDALED
jgi:ATP phosphoribosyltransferase regulatory subunit HisZ